MTKACDLFEALAARVTDLEAAATELRATCADLRANACTCAHCIAKVELAKSNHDRALAAEIAAKPIAEALDSIAALAETRRPIILARLDRNELLRFALACDESRVMLRRKLVASMDAVGRDLWELHVMDRSGSLPRHVRIERAPGPVPVTLATIESGGFGHVLKIPKAEYEVSDADAKRLCAAGLVVETIAGSRLVANRETKLGPLMRDGNPVGVLAEALSDYAEGIANIEKVVVPPDRHIFVRPELLVTWVITINAWELVLALDPSMAALHRDGKIIATPLAFAENVQLYKDRQQNNHALSGQVRPETPQYIHYVPTAPLTSRDL